MDPATETYLENLNLLHHLVWTFQRKYGGDHDELMAQANLHWWKAYCSYDPHKGSFAKRVAWIVMMELWKTKRSELKYQQRLNSQRFNRKQHDVVDRRFMEDLGLSEDGKYALKMAVPAAQKPSPGHNPSHWYSKKYRRKVLSQMLQETGWCSIRVGETFREIKSVLEKR